MISKGTTFQPLFAIDGKEPAVGFLDGKIVYSKYVVFGTTYNTQDFTFDYNPAPTVYAEPLTWHCEVLSKAGTDATNGDYYYFGMLNDMQNVSPALNPQNILTQLTSTQWQTTKVRDIIYSIPFGNYALKHIDWVVMSNGLIHSVDFSYIPKTTNPSLSLAFAYSSIVNIIGLADYLQECDGNISLIQTFQNCSQITEIELRGFTKWQNVINANTTFSGCSKCENIYISEADAYNDRYMACDFNGLSKIRNIDFEKLKWRKLSSIAFGEDVLLETITGLTGVQLKENTIVEKLFNNCRKLVSDPRVDTWVGEDGVSKPIVRSCYNMMSNCGADVPLVDRTFVFDFTGWTIVAENTNRLSLTQFMNSNGYKVRFDSLHFLPFSGSTRINLYIRGLFSNITPDLFYNTTVDFDAMIPSGVEAYIMPDGLYEFAKGNSVITTIKLGSKVKAWPDNGSITNYVLTRVFTNSIISSIDLKAQHINVYRQQTVVVQGQTEIQTDLNPLIVGDAVNWTNATQINDFVDSLVATQSKQYQMNNIKLQIQFNAAQRDIIQARPDWSTDIVTISNNGWELIFPVNVNGVWNNIDTSEMP